MTQNETTGGEALARMLMAHEAGPMFGMGGSLIGRLASRSSTSSSSVRRGGETFVGTPALAAALPFASALSSDSRL